jgi:hypothetical protein
MCNTFLLSRSTMAARTCLNVMLFWIAFLSPFLLSRFGDSGYHSWWLGLPSYTIFLLNFLFLLHVLISNITAGLLFMIYIIRRLYMSVGWLSSASPEHDATATREPHPGTRRHIPEDLNFHQQRYDNQQSRCLLLFSVNPLTPNDF